MNSHELLEITLLAKALEHKVMAEACADEGQHHLSLVHWRVYHKVLRERERLQGTFITIEEFEQEVYGG